ncbi:hypothetical protein TSMEX_006203 [Taenia solium]|eukprot:TsM_001134900 transcript=TsM_001134900 gene=TsM_001134900
MYRSPLVYARPSMFMLDSSQSRGFNFEAPDVSYSCVNLSGSGAAAVYGSCFNSVRKRQLARRKKRSNWFISPLTGFQNSGMMRVDPPPSPRASTYLSFHFFSSHSFEAIPKPNQCCREELVATKFLSYDNTPSVCNATVLDDHRVRSDMYMCVRDDGFWYK